MFNKKTVSVVTCFLRHRSKICLLKRSEMVGSSRGKWHGVSGYLPEGQDPLRQALAEIAEETGLAQDQLRLARQGPPLSFDDEAHGRCWVVYPFLFDTLSQDIRLDWEHVAVAWIEPTEMDRYDCVRGLKELYQSLI